MQMMMKKILIIEDSLPLREEVVDWLLFDGYEVYEAGSGAEGISLAVSKLPDLILCDIMMPGMNGIEVLNVLRKEPLTTLIPLIFMTALADKNDIRLGMNAGADDYITKPFSREDLLHSIEIRILRSADIMRHTDEEINDRMANLTAKNRELESFNYSVSHDLRAPLRIIREFAKLLHEDHFDQLDADGHKKLSILIDSAEKMGSLIEAFLHFSRLEKMELSNVRVGMHALAASAYNEVTLGINRDRITFSLQPLPDVICDPSLMKQVWLNLIGNAVKYSSKKERAVIKVVADQADGMVTFFVIDNGAGFNQEYADRLFIPFQRLHSDKDFSGIGIGLANISRIISRFGGTVGATGTENEGATFYFSLPCKVV
jgi:light-regulated signal transduction histidine kinase (bacteriophytochrome)